MATTPLAVTEGGGSGDVMEKRSMDSARDWNSEGSMAAIALCRCCPTNRSPGSRTAAARAAAWAASVQVGTRCRGGGGVRWSEGADHGGRAGGAPPPPPRRWCWGAGVDVDVDEVTAIEEVERGRSKGSIGLALSSWWLVLIAGMEERD